MKIEHVRIYTTKGNGTSPGYTISHIYVNGEYVCDAVEDYDRGLDQSMTLAEIRKRKVYKQTAIPTGTYELTMDIISPSPSIFSVDRFALKTSSAALAETEVYRCISSQMCSSSEAPQ